MELIESYKQQQNEIQKTCKMKKFILTSFTIFLFSISVDASNNNQDLPKNENAKKTELSTFCKMIRLGNVQVVRALINNGTNINRKSLGLTPVMYAARYNETEILQLLIDNGASLHTKSDKGFTAIQYAIMSKANKAYDVLEATFRKK